MSTSRSCIGCSGVSGVFVFVTGFGLIRMALCVGLCIELIPWRFTLKICCGTGFERSSRPWIYGVDGFMLVWQRLLIHPVLPTSKISLRNISVLSGLVFP